MMRDMERKVEDVRAGYVVMARALAPAIARVVAAMRAIAAACLDAQTVTFDEELHVDEECWRDDCPRPATTAVGLCRPHLEELRDAAREEGRG